MPVKVRKPKTEVKSPENKGRTLAERATQHPLLTLREEVDRLFDDFFSGFSLGPFGRHGIEFDPFRRMERTIGTLKGISPKTDLSETDKAFNLSIELPGMDENDIEVTLSEGILTIEGEKQDEKKEKGKDYHLTERYYGSVHRSFRIPDTVNQDKVEATFKKGVLQLKMPKIKAKGPSKKVAINVK